MSKTADDDSNEHNYTNPWRCQRCGDVCSVEYRPDHLRNCDQWGVTHDSSATQIRNADGELVDGAGRRLYSVSEDVARLHHRVYDLGWRHDPAASAYRNLRALVEIAPDAGRQTVEGFAFRFILGYGPGGVSLQRALDRLGVSHGGGSL
jgi:hypothetical protein